MLSPYYVSPDEAKEIFDYWSEHRSITETAHVFNRNRRTIRKILKKAGVSDEELVRSSGKSKHWIEQERKDQILSDMLSGDYTQEEVAIKHGVCTHTIGALLKKKGYNGNDLRWYRNWKNKNRQSASISPTQVVEEQTK